MGSQKIALFAFTVTDGVPKTGDAANITAYVSKDHGAVTVLGDTSATEMDATNAKGWYLFDLTQGETNGDELLFTAKSATADISIVGRPISTLPAAFTSHVAQTGDVFPLASTEIAEIYAAVITNAAGTDIAADIIAMKADTAAILLDTGTDGVIVAAASKTGYALSSAGVTAIWAEVMEGTRTAVQFMRGFASALLGKLSGGGTATEVFRDIDDTKNRITATVDASGNRSAITLDVT